MNPEQGQKIPEVATEAHAPTEEITENSSDIPKSVTINGSDNNKVIEEDICNEEKSENHPEDLPLDGNIHQPGEVHTV